MTRKARALRMSRTVYKNAPACRTTTRSPPRATRPCSRLAIQDRFPKYYRYFATRDLRLWRGVRMRNHNRLLGRVDGVDGIKTGYTRASGFNLVTSVKRGNRHIVAVVLGGTIGRPARCAHARIDREARSWKPRSSAPRRRSPKRRKPRRRSKARVAAAGKRAAPAPAQSRRRSRKSRTAPKQDRRSPRPPCRRPARRRRPARPIRSSRAW